MNRPQVNQEPDAPQSTYIVLSRARSSARFSPDDGIEVTISDVPGSAKPVRFRSGTRWVDEGHDAPTPRELWIEAVGPAQTLNKAAAIFGSAGRFFSNILAFTANAAVDIPEVHIAYDATPGCTEREFLEVFLPDEVGPLREGRIVKSGEVLAVFEGLRASGSPARLGRAAQQYGLALRHWYFGGEWLSLAHLYMAAETLTRAMIRHQCERHSLQTEELARRQGIDIDDDGKWKHRLEVWARRDVIFDGDRETYNKARSASDGIEHGFMEFEDVNRKALDVTDKVFSYIRRAILTLLKLPEMDFPDLWQRPPRDVASLRKIIRGHLVGDGTNPAVPGEDHPRLKWTSRVSKLERTGENLSVSFEEKFTVRCSPGYGFRGQAIEVRGRLEPGQPTYAQSVVAEVSQSAAPAVPSEDSAFDLIRQAKDLAVQVAASGTSVGFPPALLNVFGLFGTILSLFEAIEVLLRDDRPVEAAVLLHSMMTGTCRLESIASHANPAGAALKARLDAMERHAGLLEARSDEAQAFKGKIEEHRTMAAAMGVIAADSAPEARAGHFYDRNQNSIRLLDEIALADELAAVMHTVTDTSGNQALNTKILDPALRAAVAADAVDALITAAVSLAATMQWPIDHDAVRDIQRRAIALREASADS
ncbi:hypothetical protein ACFOWZ_44500 [Lentzea rhizosphaerae]|uniref:Uncharacterized protein n=1 Tax=Lentzea rhizosphaerae TaxID=2041025 RepID=A0ABV8C8Y3_9PSEU